ncbi:hypothetical protein F157LOC_04299 [Pectobacterium brasiliense]|nr:hypothetical protein F157LOC_04299 [Pectobacterium brasiliense]
MRALLVSMRIVLRVIQGKFEVGGGLGRVRFRIACDAATAHGVVVIWRKKLCSGGRDRRVSDRTSRKPVPRRERVTGGSVSGHECRWHRAAA